VVSQDGVAPSQMVRVSASVNLHLHHKVQKFSSGTDSPRWSQKKGRKMVVVVVVVVGVFATMTHAQWAFSVAGPLVWNLMPDYLRDPAVSTDTFVHGVLLHIAH